MKPEFNNASADTRRLNPHLFPKFPESVLEYETRSQRKISHAKPERDQAPALGSAVSGKAKGLSRPIIRFVGYRVRPLDPDNFAGSVKDLLDGIRHAGLIPDDTIWKIKLETEQIKVKRFSEEKTVIEIDL